MPIRYKVVKRKTRNSAIINGNSHYARKYLPGTIVVAELGTLGIMTFINKSSAMNWADDFNIKNWSGYNDEISLITIKVEGIGRGYVPLRIAAGIDTDSLKSFYEDGDYDCHTYNPIDNTICYKSVRVLE